MYATDIADLFNLAKSKGILLITLPYMHVKIMIRTELSMVHVLSKVY